MSAWMISTIFAATFGVDEGMATLTPIAQLVSAIAWPIVALLGLLLYGSRVIAIFSRSKIRLSLFGVEVETTEQQLEKILTEPVGDQLTAKQWELLDEVWRRGTVSVSAKRYSMSMEGGDLPWIRPVRNAGLIMSLPDGLYIEQATDLVLTPLGRVLMAARDRKSGPGAE